MFIINTSAQSPSSLLKCWCIHRNHLILLLRKSCLCHFQFSPLSIPINPSVIIISVSAARVNIGQHNFPLHGGNIRHFLIIGREVFLLFKHWRSHYTNQQLSVIGKHIPFPGPLDLFPEMSQHEICIFLRKGLVHVKLRWWNQVHFSTILQFIIRWPVLCYALTVYLADIFTNNSEI